MNEKYKLLNATEFAELLKEKLIIDFTFDEDLNQEPTGWYGMTISNSFDGASLLMGDYGRGIIDCCNLENTDVAEAIQKMWNDEMMYRVDKVCCDMSEL